VCGKILLEPTDEKAGPDIRNPKSAGTDTARRLNPRNKKGDMELSYENSKWHSRKLYCPNCRHLVIGYEGKDGATRMTWDRCQTVMVSKRMGRRHDRIDIYAPVGQERI
jgi:ribosomal protein S27E